MPGFRSERYGRIARFTLAECIENKGRFVEPLLSVRHQHDFNAAIVAIQGVIEVVGNVGDRRAG